MRGASRTGVCDGHFAGQQAAAASDDRLGRGRCPRPVAGEQWPHRKQDIADGLKLGAGTVAEIGGEIIASAMWWLHGDDLATLGMYIVAKPFRGGGIGRIVMEAVLDQIGERSILLNAYHGGPSIFRKFGFRAFRRSSSIRGRLSASPCR
jgi:GNAT superfamily N-acetyltransferase